MRYLLDPDLLEAQSGFEALPSDDKDHKKIKKNKRSYIRPIQFCGP
jgi:hypothetical protein